jgi:hypothetical protein
MFLGPEIASTGRCLQSAKAAIVKAACAKNMFTFLGGHETPDGLLEARKGSKQIRVNTCCALGRILPVCEERLRRRDRPADPKSWLPVYVRQNSIGK